MPNIEGASAGFEVADEKSEEPLESPKSEVVVFEGEAFARVDFGSSVVELEGFPKMEDDVGGLSEFENKEVPEKSDDFASESDF